MKITYVSKHGKTKEQSQDCILVNDTVINNYAGTLDVPLKRLCIADGVGGVAGGYEASSYVLKHFLDCKTYKSGEELMQFLISINDDLIEYASSLDGKANMATTFTGIARIDSTIWLMHAGNTRLYAFIDGKLQQITTDHTNYQAMVVDGNIDMAGDYVSRNIIYCCFGTGNRNYLNALQVEPMELSHMPDFILMTSDGVHDYIEHSRMEEILTNNLDDRNKILELLSEANSNGSNDDCTIVIARS